MNNSKKKNLANIHIRLPADEKAVYERYAEKHGFTLATWIRMHLQRITERDR